MACRRAPLRGQDPENSKPLPFPSLATSPRWTKPYAGIALAAQTLKQRLFEPLPDEPQLEQESRERDELFRGLHEEGARMHDAKKGDASVPSIKKRGRGYQATYRGRDGRERTRTFN